MVLIPAQIGINIDFIDSIVDVEVVIGPVYLPCP